MQLKYNLKNSGWADATLEDRGKKIFLEVSYLHDSLAQLVEAIIALLEGSPEQVVIFMTEPGEHQLTLKVVEGTGSFELRWFKDWASWNLYPKHRFKRVRRGLFELQPLAQCILLEVESIYCAHGLEGYKRKWLEHDFPYQQYLKLKRLLQV